MRFLSGARPVRAEQVCPPLVYSDAWRVLANAKSRCIGTNGFLHRRRC